MKYKELVELTVYTKLVYFLGRAMVEHMALMANVLASSIVLASSRFPVLAEATNSSLAVEMGAMEVVADTQHDEHTSLVRVR